MAYSQPARAQFLSEAVLLGLLGGVVGVAVGTAATAFYAHTKHWATIIPIEAWAGGITALLTVATDWLQRGCPPTSRGMTALTQPLLNALRDPIAASNA